MKSRKSRLKASSILIMVVASCLGQLGCSRPSTSSVAESSSHAVPSHSSSSHEDRPAPGAMRASPAPDDDLTGTAAWDMPPGEMGLKLNDGPVLHTKVGGSAAGFVGATAFDRASGLRSAVTARSPQRSESTGLVAVIRLGLVAWLWRPILLFLNADVTHAP